MGHIQLADHLKTIIDQQVAEGRAESEAAFLERAVHLYARVLIADQEAVVAAADEGSADIAAGRFIIVAGPDDAARMMADIWDDLDGQTRPADESRPCLSV